MGKENCLFFFYFLYHHSRQLSIEETARAVLLRASVNLPIIDCQIFYCFSYIKTIHVIYIGNYGARFNSMLWSIFTERIHIIHLIRSAVISSKSAHSIYHRQRLRENMKKNLRKSSSYVFFVFSFRFFFSFGTSRNIAEHVSIALGIGSASVGLIGPVSLVSYTQSSHTPEWSPFVFIGFPFVSISNITLFLRGGTLNILCLNLHFWMEKLAAFLEYTALGRAPCTFYTYTYSYTHVYRLIDVIHLRFAYKFFSFSFFLLSALLRMIWFR